MSRLTNQDYLRSDQYQNGSKLNARIYVHRHFSTNSKPWQQWVFQQLDLPSPCDVLDVGCGPADLWADNVIHIPDGWRITLSDLSSGMVDEARQNLNYGHHCFRYQVLDGQAIPFADESFDAIIANHMLYHVPAREVMIDEAYRVLRSDGQLYVATNGLNHLRELRELVRRFCPDADATNVAAEFGLENGADQLSKCFTHVTRRRQENALVVTETEPLVAYALSMMCRASARQSAEELDRWIRHEITSRGAIHIQKDSGIFIARKSQGAF